MTLPRPSGSPYRIAFVCLGNICRSPMAEVVLTRMLEQAGLSQEVQVTSCGTGGWHVGEPMDPRAARELVASGYDASGHRAQQFDPSWLERDLVLAMDASNLADIVGTTTGGPGDEERVRLFRSFDPRVSPGAGPADLDVPDPWFGGDEGFREVLDMVERTCRRIVVELESLEL